MAHQWRFFRSGGFDQVRLDKIEDWQQLSSLDPKLWAALSCPVKGLELDPRMMAYLDDDHDGRRGGDDLRCGREPIGHRRATVTGPEPFLSNS